MRKGIACSPRGFTLIEVVVSLTLVSLVMLALLAAMRTFANTSYRLEERTDGIEEIVALSHFLRQSASTIFRRAPTRSDEPPVSLEGAAHELRWIGILPARFGAGGVNYFRLSTEQLDGRPVLSLRFAPYVAGAVPWAALPAEPQFRLDDLREFRIAFRATGESNWRSEWRDPMALPGQISFQLSTAGSRWPDIVIAPQLLLPGGSRPGSGEIVIGGSAS